LATTFLYKNALANYFISTNE